MRIFTTFLGIFSVAATALPFILSAQWQIRIFDYPRLQTAVICLIAIVLNLFRPLDDFFYSADFGLVRLKKLDSIGSDHFPMIVELSLNPEKDYAKHKPKDDMQDKEEMNEIIEDGK